MKKTVTINCGLLDGTSKAGYYFGLKGGSPMYNVGPLNSSRYLESLNIQLDSIKSQYDSETEFVVNREDIKI